MYYFVMLISQYSETCVEQPLLRPYLLVKTGVIIWSSEFAIGGLLRHVPL